MRQAIVTKYFGPTNSRGARIRAKCRAATKYYPYRHELSAEENHEDAAWKLKTKMNWDGRLDGGAMPDGTGYCFVFRETVVQS
jgi:hypothetical protein